MSTALTASFNAKAVIACRMIITFQDRPGDIDAFPALWTFYAEFMEYIQGFGDAPVPKGPDIRFPKAMAIADKH